MRGDMTYKDDIILFNLDAAKYGKTAVPFLPKKLPADIRALIAQLHAAGGPYGPAAASDGSAIKAGETAAPDAAGFAYTKVRIVRPLKELRGSFDEAQRNPGRAARVKHLSRTEK